MVGILNPDWSIKGYWVNKKVIAEKVGINVLSRI